jgi:hypothetical protein
MALVIDDRVRETTTVTGTNDATLLGAVTGFQAFSVIGNGNTTYYTISDQSGGNWEVGLGTFSSVGPTLARTTVLSSSAGGAKVSFPAGTKDVFVTYPSDKAVYLDESGNVQPALGNVVASQVNITAQGDLRLEDTTGGQYVALQAPGTVATSYTLTLPVDDGTNGQALITDGSGNLSWSTAASGDVYGPASATNNGVALFDGTTGKIIKNSSSFVQDGSGNVGIGTASPSQKLQVSGTTFSTRFISGSGLSAAAPDYSFSADDTMGMFRLPGVLGFSNGGTERMRITSTGDVGIGTTNPAGKLEVLGSVANSIANAGTADAATITITNNDVSSIGRIAKTLYEIGNLPIASISGVYTDFNAGSDIGGALAFSTQRNLAGGVLERMRILSDGSVGIGTATPNTKFTVVTSTTNAGISVNDGTVNTIIYNSSGPSSSIGTTTNHPVQFYTNNLIRAGIGADGNIAIGTVSNPGNTLRYFDIQNNNAGNSAGAIIRLITNNVANTAATTVDIVKYRTGGFYINNNDTDAAVFTAFNVGASERLRINSSGNVGIGTSSPAVRLHIKAPASNFVAFGQENTNGGTNEKIVDWLNNGTAYSLRLLNDAYNTANTAYQVERSGITVSNHAWYTGSSSERMRIDSNGRVMVATTSAVENFQVGNGTADTRAAFRPSTSYAIGVANGAAFAGWIGGSGVTDTMVFSSSGGTERMRIDAAGNVGIGTSNPAAFTGGSNGLAVSINGNSGMAILRNSATSGVTFDQLQIGVAQGASANYHFIRCYHSVNTAATPVHFVNGNGDGYFAGDLSIGTGSSVARLSVANLGTTNSTAVDLLGQRNFVATTYGATSIVAVSDGTRNAHDFGAIRFEQNPDTSDGGGALVRLFAGGASSSFAASTEFLRGEARGNTNGVDNIQFRTAGTERMRIDLSGNVGIGEINTSRARFTVGNDQADGAQTVANSGILFSSNGGTIGGNRWGQAAIYPIGSTSFSGSLVFATSGAGAGSYVVPTERMRIVSGGDVLIGTTANIGSGFKTVISGGGNGLGVATTGGNGTQFCGFFYTSTSIGSISNNSNTGVLFNTTSDYRLKTVIAPVTNAGQRIDALQPIEYDWNIGGRAKGFLAHQFAEVYPNSVTGEKDAVDAEGKPAYQSMQASSTEVMADLIAEIQSLRKRVAQLESK